MSRIILTAVLLTSFPLTSWAQSHVTELLQRATAPTRECLSQTPTPAEEVDEGANEPVLVRLEFPSGSAPTVLHLGVSPDSAIGSCIRDSIANLTVPSYEGSAHRAECLLPIGEGVAVQCRPMPQPAPPVRTPSSPCDGVTCNGNGTCTVLRGAPVCNCSEGYQRPSDGPLEQRFMRCVRMSPEEEANVSAVSHLDREDSRLWGFGSRLGAGYLGGGFPAAENVIVVGTGLKLDLASLDFRYFFANGNSIDVSTYLVTTIVAAALGVFYIDPFLSYSFNFGSGRVRSSIGVGARLIFAAGSGMFKFGLRIPVNFAVEFLSSRRTFGFQLYARPFFHLQPDRELTGVGGGIMGGIAFFGYRDSRSN